MFRNIRIKTLIILGLGFLTGMLVFIGVTGLRSIHSTASQLQNVSLGDVKTVAVVEKIRFKMEINRSQVLQALQHNPVMEWSKLHDHSLDVHAKIISGTNEEINQLWSAYAANIKSPEERALAEDWYAKSGRLGVDAITTAYTAIQENRWDQGQLTLIQVINPTYRVSDVALRSLTDFLAQRSQANDAVVHADIDQASYVMLGVIVLSALLAVTTGYILVRGITVPLNQAVGVARRVAQGDLTGHIDVTSTNEIGELLHALKDMNSSLARIVHGVRSATDMIGTASGQIASGNLDLSSRTEQQASSLEETASSMEELTGTVKQNGENARQANQLAMSAAEVAVKGGNVVSEVVVTMGSINESARKIVDIISVIDGIAFQTNILALNAAVEAARAGEQGRGFAVVASEVRSLAQRSAGAAKEIKALISDSVEKADTGSKLVDQAGATMEEIVASVKRVTDIMGEISSASQEQSAGIEQINQAIAQMDQMTQQNATLVEEAAAAAGSMEEQAKNLVQVVGVFKLGDGQSAALTLVSSNTDAQYEAAAFNAIGATNRKIESNSRRALVGKKRISAIAS